MENEITEEQREKIKKKLESLGIFEHQDYFIDALIADDRKV